MKKIMHIFQRYARNKQRYGSNASLIAKIAFGNQLAPALLVENKQAYYMVHEFRIRFTLKTIKGYEPLCDFYIGDNPEIALALFNQLEGSDEVREADILQLDFMEIKNGLPVNVKIRHCTLLQMTSNCGLITKEIFKYRNLVEAM